MVYYDNYIIRQGAITFTDFENNVLLHEAMNILQLNEQKNGGKNSRINNRMVCLIT